MRASYFLTFAASCLISGVAFGQASPTPDGSDGAVTKISTNEHGGVINAVRGFIAKLSPEGGPQSIQGRPRSNWIDHGIEIGESLPETVELHSIPMHDTYRYAVVNDRRVIVDATSRNVVYVIPVTLAGSTDRRH
jgi:hypothetical protein